MSTAEQYQVTYLNRLDGKRHVLIDAVDKETAESVVAKFGNNRDLMYYMGPDLRIEPNGQEQS